MANPVNMPPLGESVTEGTVTRWLKQVGDRVEQDEPLVEIATDKVDTEIPSPVAGTLLEISVAEDETAEVGAQLAVIGEESEAGGSGSSGGTGGSQGAGSAGEPGGDEAVTPQVREEEKQDSGAEADAAPQPAPEDTEDSVPAAQADTPAEAPSTEADAPAQKPEVETRSGGAGTEIVMPALGESVTEGTITRWLKAEGDSVEVDEPIVEIATDKVDTELPSPVAGTVLRILVQEDETAEVGTPLVVVGDAASPSAASPSAASPSAAAPDAPEAPAEQPSTDQPVADAPSEHEPTTQDSSAEEYNSPEAQVPQPTALDTTPTTPSTDQGSGDTDLDTDHGTGLSAVASGDASGYITPIVRKLASEKGVDLSTITGTGVGGRVRRQDVLAAADAAEKAARDAAEASRAAEKTSLAAQTPVAETPAPAEASVPAEVAVAAPAAASAPAASVDPKRGTRVKMSRLRKVIAQRMVESLQVSAQLTTVVEVDVTRVAALRVRAKNGFAQREGVKLSFLPFFALAAVEALKAYPVVNASVDGDEIVYHGGEHLGVAVDTERGLLVPVIRDAGDLNIAGLARKIADLAERTRTNKVSPDELSGGTFTLTNTGSRGALFDTPILNQPQVAILGTGSVVKRPVVVTDAEGNESIAVRSMVYLALSYDHRIVDGADAARFLAAVRTRLEDGAFESDLGL